MANKKFDVVLTGASPILMLEAYFQAKNGKSVAVLEEQSFAGGAWYTRNIWDFKNVEMGCHIMEKYTGRAYHFLSEIVEIPMAQVTPQPEAILKNSILSQEVNSFRYDFNVFFSAFIRFRWKKALPLFTRLCKTFWGMISGNKYMYPQNGCGAMNDRLVELNNQVGTKIFFDTKIESVHVNHQNSQAYCNTSLGRIEFDQMIVAPNIKLNSFSFGPSHIELPKQQHTLCHIIMHLKGKKKKGFSYVNISTGSMVNRVSDVGDRNMRKGELMSNGQLILCIQIEGKSRQEMSAKGFADDVLKELINLELIKKGAKIENSHLEFLTVNRIDPNLKDLFQQKLQPFVTLFDTSDLTMVIADNADRWSTN